jgi:precorrin-2 dehydrogenase/sirohydrochlorin ferrochelatase
MNLYPIFASLKDKTAVIIGGGKVALRKLGGLLDSGAKVKIISPEHIEEIVSLQQKYPSSIEIIKKEYEEGDLEKAYIAFAATGDPGVNKAVFQEAARKNILINSADDPENCSFYVPSMAHRGNLTIAVSTAGDSPAMAAGLIRKFENSIPENIEDVLSALRDARQILKKMNKLTSGNRGNILKKIAGDDKLLKKLVQRRLEGGLEDMLKDLL